jgi:hypothetical protein
VVWATSGAASRAHEDEAVAGCNTGTDADTKPAERCFVLVNRVVSG